MKKRFFYRFIKRFFDIVFALLGLLLSSLIWLIAIIGIELSDPGPVFYIAKRVGKDNREFKMFKFRSMRVVKGADEKSFKADTDRIFKFGEFIRSSKIDELPQLLNILLGHMSIVGPRPASKDQVDVVRAGKYADISCMRPGLTAHSALYDYIYGDTIEDEKEYERLVLPTRLDLELVYIKKCGFWVDIKLIFQTAYCIIMTIFKKQPKKLLNKLIQMAEEERISSGGMSQDEGFSENEDELNNLAFDLEDITITLDQK